MAKLVWNTINVLTRTTVLAGFMKHKLVFPYQLVEIVVKLVLIHTLVPYSKRREVDFSASVSSTMTSVFVAT